MARDHIADSIIVLERDYYRAGEAAERLGMTPAALANWSARGKMQPDYRIGEGKRSLAFYSKARIDKLATALFEAEVS